jgi:hypothetical protein
MHEPSRGARLALAYITTGTLGMIWSALWYWRLLTHETPPDSLQHIFCLGFFLSGLALLVIGLLVGRIGLEARNADVPVGQVTAAVVAPPGTPVATPAVPGVPVQPGTAAPAVVVQGSPNGVPPPAPVLTGEGSSNRTA